MGRVEDSAILEGDDRVGDIGDSVVVRHHQDRALLVASDFTQEVDDLAAGLAVEGGGRFVGEDEAGPMHEGPRDGDSLSLSAREL